MSLAEHLKAAVQTAVNETFADEVQEIVARETRRAFREHESQFTSIVRTAVAEAIAAMLTEGG
jgi:hypothetical protein